MGATALLAGALSFATTEGFAMPRYDGLWSVSIVTTKGDCIASYRYPMRIANGILANGGCNFKIKKGSGKPSMDAAKSLAFGERRELHDVGNDDRAR